MQRTRCRSVALRSPFRDAVDCSSTSWSLSHFSAHAASGRCSLVLMLIHLRGVAAIVTVGRHHHRGTSHEGLGHRLALPAAALPHRALLDASQQGAQALPDRILRAGSRCWTRSASFQSWHEATARACSRASLLANASLRRALSRCCRRCSGRALEVAARACEVVAGGCKDMVSRASLCSDSTTLYSTHGRRRAAHGLPAYQIFTKSRRYLGHTL